MTPVFELIIALLLYWYLLSGLTMQALEWVASSLQWRSKDLYGGIRKIFGSEGLTFYFYRHPLIQGLHVGGGENRRMPSYIPASQFSSAIINILHSADHELFFLSYNLQWLSAKISVIKDKRRRSAASSDLDRILALCSLDEPIGEKPNEAFTNLVAATAERNLQNLAETFPELADDISAALTNINLQRDKSLEQLKSLQHVEATGDGGDLDLVEGMMVIGTISPKLKTLFGSLMPASVPAGGGHGPSLTDHLKSELEKWYNASMDRLSGHYKRKTQWAAFLIGICGALLFNLDSLEFAGNAWKNAALRQVLQTIAESRITGSTGSPLDLSPESILSDLSEFPIGWKFDTAPLAGGECHWIPPANQPIGIKMGRICLMPGTYSTATNGWSWLSVKLAGFLLTAFACAQGASYWFDILKRFINVRFSGRKPLEFG